VTRALPLLAALALVALALAVLPACVKANRPLEPPRAELRGSSSEAAPDGLLTIHLELSVFNPNDSALELRAIDWQLSISDHAIARGRDEHIVPLPARATTSITATIHSRQPGDITGTLHCFSGTRGITTDFSGTVLTH
jgi:hypothetical protein